MKALHFVSPRTQLSSALLCGTPFFFPGIKSFQTMEDEVIIQPELRWVARPNVKVVVKAFGLKFSAHVSHYSCAVTQGLGLPGDSDTTDSPSELDEVNVDGGRTLAKA